MPPPSALQVGSLATTSRKFLPTQKPCKTSLQKSLLTLPASLHFSSTRRFSAPLKSWIQIHHDNVSIKRRAAKEVSDVAETDEEEIEASIPQGPDDDVPRPGLQFAEFAGGRFWFLELAFQRVPGVMKTEVGYSQGHMHNPTFADVERGNTGHANVVRLQYTPNEVSYDDLLDNFWESHDPTQKNRQGFYLGSHYRSGIYFYSPEQEKAARESLERQQKKLGKKIVTEILPAKKFYRAEKVHQKCLKRGVFTSKQSAAKGCKDPIRDQLLFP